jgi:hypothetical protein
VANKRDRKRLQARRTEQRRHDEANRERQKHTEELLAQMVDYIAEVQKVATEPGRPPDDFARQLRTAFESEHVGQALAIPALAWASAAEVGQEVDTARGLELADAVSALIADHPGAAWWSSSLYYYAGEVTRAEEIATGALTGHDDGEALNLVGHLRRDKGDLASAAELAYRRVEADPADADAQRQLGRSLILVGVRLNDPPADGEPCGCGSGRAWSTCCQAAEEAAWNRFVDGSRIRALWDHLDRFVAGDADLAGWQDECLAEWTARLGQFDRLLSTDVTDPVRRMAKECSAIRGPEWPADDVRSALDDDGNSVLSRFASDPETPLDAAELARAWQERAACGLWQVENPDTQPGLWVTELVTRQNLFVHVPPAMRSQIRRWSVLAGVLIPDRGVWRATSVLGLLDPDEGDLAAEVAQATVANVVRGLAVERHLKGGKHLPERKPQIPNPPPWGVLASMADPLDEAEARLTNTVLAVALPAILSEVQRAHPNPTAPHGLGADMDTWLDRPNPELEGMTPRQATNEAKSAAWLERMLRRWEHAADGYGLAGVDVDAIRAALADEDGEPFYL